MRHPPADAMEVEPDALGRVEQAPGRLVQREPAGGRLLEDALADQMCRHAVQHTGVAARRRGKLVDAGGARTARSTSRSPTNCVSRS